MVALSAPKPTPILIEKRFPLDLSLSIKTIADLYSSSKTANWRPLIDIPWADLDVSDHSVSVRRAVALTWSRRAWLEYSGIAETPALIVRFCLEPGRAADPKYYLSVRNTEETWHIDCCHKIAESFGGYSSAPTSAAYAELFNQALAKQALNADTFLDSYIAAHCALEDGIDLQLWRGYLENCQDPVIKRTLQLCVENKIRHAAFGWMYLEERVDSWNDEDRANIVAALVHQLQEVEFRGYHCAWMAADGAADEIVSADTVTAEAGLGALAPEAEAVILSDYLELARKKFSDLGIELPNIDFPSPNAMS